MAYAVLKRSAMMKSVAGSLRIAASRAFASVSVGSDLVSAAKDVSLQKARTWDEGVESKFSTTPLKDIFKDKKVVIFGLPGAFTGVCSAQHVPSYKKNVDNFKSKGVDHVICVAVNDPYVMNGWAEKLQAKDAVSYIIPFVIFSRSEHTASMCSFIISFSFSLLGCSNDYGSQYYYLIFWIGKC
ncbi:peroxiredoxin-2F, mitochondrial [Diospyros lotus]|uniref:peroxiredoxin-2F, mitochondrial n=1 Tax=Diospyros lotus TaxID=55363 RepID=UPI00224D60AA|nr:peroxiredoxin-2F, mitochondrial [Diospyros lotus]